MSNRGQLGSLQGSNRERVKRQACNYPQDSHTLPSVCHPTDYWMVNG